MLISPPSLHHRQQQQSDADWLASILPDPSVGRYPLSTGFEWHGGIHVLLNGSGEANTVRAIASGNVIHFRDCGPGELRPEPDSPIARFGLNSPGCVVMRHETEIGAGPDGHVVFFSVYQHLANLKPAVRDAFKTGKLLPRKQALGQSGYAGGKAGFHFEIFCNSENLRRLTGRTGGLLPLTQHGRDNILFGDIHFYLPAATPLYRFANEQADWSPRHASLRPASHTDRPLFVTLQFDKGNISLYTRQQQGQHYPLLPDTHRPAYWHNYEAGMAKLAGKIADQYPAASASAVYELLRFGRLVAREQHSALPAQLPHWHQINTPTGWHWVNLASNDIKKYSDADFPHWLGWTWIDDDPSDDGLCQSPTLHGWLLPPGQPKTRDSLLAAIPAQQARLSRTICRFPTEWDSNKVDARYGWVRQESAFNPKSEVMSAADYRVYKIKIEMLSFWQQILPRSMVQAGKSCYQEERNLYDRSLEDHIWHFHPREFIQVFRKCKWLSSVEMEMAVLPEAKPKQGPNAEEQIRRYKIPLNLAMRKYLIDTGLRCSHFIGQGCVESNALKSMVETAQYQDYVLKIGKRYIDESLIYYEMKEKDWWGSKQKDRVDIFNHTRYTTTGTISGNSYAWRNGNIDTIDAQKFRGRGFKQLTGRSNYAQYWRYRGWLAKSSFDEYWWDDPAYKNRQPEKMKRRPAIINNPHIIAIDPYNCIDSGAYFITAERPQIKLHMQSMNDNSIIEVSRAINGGIYAKEQRIKQSYRAYHVLGDEIEPKDKKEYLSKYVERFTLAIEKQGHEK
ncbi:hypothetical protein [Aquitalea pelogenes]|uniref:hypothetical protein n=1 Tax=Aquitalea pelogenes TaxID=1293573 RepID=UPI000788776A|nr:hypothetical protein [Aquitalea pelogenes]